MEREFSWSYTRYSLFRKCPLAYYFHYYGSWGGWDSYCDKRTAEIYFLKKLQTADEWIELLIRKAVTDAFSRGLFDSGEIVRGIFSLFNRHIALLRKKSSEDLAIAELYYGIYSQNELETGCKEKLLQLTANYADNYFISKLFNDIEYQELKKLHRPSYFYSDGIKVWNSPDIIIEKRGKIIVYNIFSDSPLNDDSWALRTGINRLFAENTYPGRDIETVSLFLHQKKFPPIYASRNRKEIKTIIRDSSHTMLKVTDFDTDIKEELFAPTEEKETCASCRFRELCCR